MYIDCLTDGSIDFRCSSGKERSCCSLGKQWIHTLHHHQVMEKLFFRMRKLFNEKLIGVSQ
jgi:hypothetical protein